MEDIQKLIVDDIEYLFQIESTQKESDPNLFDVDLYGIDTNDLILKCKAYIYERKLKLLIKDLSYLFNKYNNGTINIKSEDVPMKYKLKIYYNGNKMQISRCKLSSEFRLFLSESMSMEIEPVEITFLLKEGENLIVYK